MVGSSQQEDGSSGLLGGLIGLAGGFLSGIFGIGGGLVIVPGLILFLGMTQKQASGTSLALILRSGSLGALEYWRAGYIDVRLAALLAVGILIGAFFQARLAIGLPSRLIQRAFGVFLVLVGVRLALWV